MKITTTAPVLTDVNFYGTCMLGQGSAADWAAAVVHRRRPRCLACISLPRP